MDTGQNSSSSEEELFKNVRDSNFQSLSQSLRETTYPYIEGDLSYQQFLLLQVKIEAARENILSCGLAIAECLNALEVTLNHIKTSEHHQNKKNIKQQVGCFTFAERHSNLKETLQLLQKAKKCLQQFKKVLTIRDVQLTMIFFVIERKNQPNFEELYDKNFGELKDFIIKPKDCQKKINVFILDDLLKKQQDYLQTFLSQGQQLRGICQLLQGKSTEQEKHYVEDTVSKIKITSSKINTICLIFAQACVMNIEDLMSLSQIHPRWQRLLKNQTIIYYKLSDQASLQNSFRQIKENLNVINAAMSIIDRHRLQATQPLNRKMAIFYQQAIGILKCALSKKQAKFEAEVMISEGKDDLAKQIWNLPENKNFRQFIKISLPSITYSERLYIPRLYRQYFYIQRHQKIQNPNISRRCIQKIEEYRQELFKKKPYQEAIRIRLNYCRNLIPKIEQRSKQAQTSFLSGINTFFGSVTNIFKNKQKSPKAVIFHIHGGGFISMSSFIHQAYTRIWSNNLQIPIISVDYGKAPDHPFPEGLYDCLQAYLWTIFNFQQIYEIQPQKIILVGDSAGGNLVAALTTLLIEWKLPIPTGIVLVYPALNLRISDYTPSLLTALNDMILPHTFLKVCANAYIGKNSSKQANDNPFLSPILTSDETLSQYPQTHIFVGNKDPFHDDCCRFIERLRQTSKLFSNFNKNNNRLNILQEFPHGFLQFDLKLMPNQYSRNATKLVENSLHHLIYGNQIRSH